MTNIPQNIIRELKKGYQLELVNKHFSNESILNKSVQSSILGDITFFNVDFIRSHVVACNFKNCRFNDVMPMYRINSITFPIIEFIRYIGINPTSHFQRINILNILTTLQTLKPIIQNFDDHYFQSSLIVPAFNIKKKKNKLIVSVVLAKELYLYSHPF